MRLHPHDRHSASQSAAPQNDGWAAASLSEGSSRHSLDTRAGHSLTKPFCCVACSRHQGESTVVAWHVALRACCLLRAAPRVLHHLPASDKKSFTVNAISKAYMNGPCGEPSDTKTGPRASRAFSEPPESHCGLCTPARHLTGARIRGEEPRAAGRVVPSVPRSTPDTPTL